MMLLVWLSRRMRDTGEREFDPEISFQYNSSCLVWLSLQNLNPINIGPRFKTLPLQFIESPSNIDYPLMYPIPSSTIFVLFSSASAAFMPPAMVFSRTPVMIISRPPIIIVASRISTIVLSRDPITALSRSPVIILSRSPIIIASRPPIIVRC